MYTATSSVDSSVRSFLINPLRILEYMLGATCLIIHIYCTVILNVKMTETFKNLIYVTVCSFIIIISHDLILTCVKKPLDQSTWLPFSSTATILYAVCAGMSTVWELSSYIKWIYLIMTVVNTLIFGIDSLNILWQFRKKMRARTIILPSERPSTRQSVIINNKKREDELPESISNSAPPEYITDSLIPSQRPIAESMHSVAIQCDSLEQMDLHRLPSVHSTSRYVPAAVHPIISTPTNYTHYHKRKRHGCHGCHACDPISTIDGSYNIPPIAGGSPSSHLGPNSFGLGGASRPATTTSTYGGTFHVSKDIAPLSSPTGSARQGVSGSSAHKMKSPWTNESLYVWEAKPTRFGDDVDDFMKKY